MTTPSKIRLLIVDDSPVVRRSLMNMLENDAMIEVVGTAADPFEARDKILSLQPDVLTLDIEMPKMDGLSFLKILMKEYPMPVIIFSSLSQANSQIALNALEFGAIDTMAKPNGPHSVNLMSQLIKTKIKGAYAAKGQLNTLQNKIANGPQSPQIITPTGNIDSRKIILIGSSTGGTEALREIIPALPGNMPGICIVQHIPPVFSKAFAKRLDEISALTVKEAEEGDEITQGLVLVAPGNYHMKMIKSGVKYKVTLTQTPPVWHQRPAVDILFQSAVNLLGRTAVAALLTGMGKDGANGLLALKEAGAYTIAQEASSCIVYGMPKTAVELGAATDIIPLKNIPEALVKAVSLSSTHQYTHV